MSFSIKRLGPGDEAVLELLVREDADFDIEGRGGTRQPLEPVAARCYLENPAVLLWVAEEGDRVMGFLSCNLLPLRSGEMRELFLYEIGVRKSWRRKGVGRALHVHMEEWMKANGIRTVWVCADNEVAVAFYRDCGFTIPQEQPTYMIRTL